MPQSQTRQKSASRRRAFLVTSLVLVAVIFSNWVYSIHFVLPIEKVDADSTLSKDLLVDNILSLSTSKCWTGGWPFKYYVRVEHTGLPSFTTFSFYRLLLNGVAWALIGGFIYGYLWLSTRRGSVESESDKPRTGQIGLLDLFVIMVVLALGFGYWRLMVARLSEEKAFASVVAGFGGLAEESVVVPKVIANIVPTMYHPFFNRIVSVTLESPTDEVLARALALPELRRLRLGGGTYDLKRLDDLRTLPYLSELRVSGRALDNSAVAAIGSCKQIVSLNLMRTNISTEGLVAMSDMPRLEKLCLIHTLVDVSKLVAPKWKSVLKELALPHPGNAAPANPELGDGVCAKFVLRDWPTLQILTCTEFDELENETCVVLDVDNCPELREIQLDQLQCFDLFLNNLPSLARITSPGTQWRSRIRKNEKIGVDPWVRKLVQSGTPNLKDLNLFGRSIEELKLDPTSLAYIGISSEYRTAGSPQYRWVYEENLSDVYINDFPADSRQAWIDELGKGTGPAKVNLSSVELKGVDLSPLRNNRELRELDLSWTMVTARQLAKLEGSSIERIVLDGSEIDGPDVCRMLAKLSSLRELQIVSTKVNELNLESLEKLETIFKEPGPRELTKLRLMSMPNLREDFDIRWPLTKCELVEVPCLQGLSFQFSLPTDTTIRGLRDLRYFSAGGSSIDDELMNEVLNCKRLRFLTLAYATQVSNSMLAKLAELPELEYVALPGCEVNDEIIQILSKREKLTELVLDDTAVTDSSFDGFDLARLRRLSVNYTKVSEATISKMLSKDTFTGLGLAGLQLSESTVERIVKGKLLTDLDLSDTNLEPNSWKAMAEHLHDKNLRLILRNAKIDVKRIQEILPDRPSLILDLTGTTGPDLQDGNDAVVQFLLNTNQYTKTDQIIDSWQLVNPSEQKARKMVVPRSRLYLTNSKIEQAVGQGMIRHFPFSPRWKSLQKRKATP